MGKHWVSSDVNIGNIKVHRSAVIKFQAKVDIPEISDLIPDCGCTKLKYDPTTRILNVTYSAGNFPKQIVGNQQIINKRITVLYKDNTTDVLYIKGTKLR